MEDRQGYGDIGISHKLKVVDRNGAAITGVKDVVSFDAGAVILETVCGSMVIKGEQLHVSRLTLEQGEVDVDGKVDSITYSDASYEKTAGSVFGRLFR